MAILQMRQIDICALKKDRKAIMEKLQSMGVVEIAPMKNEEGLQRMDTQAPRQQFDRNVQLFEQALGILDTYAPQKQSLLASFAGKEVKQEKRYNAVCAPSGLLTALTSFLRTKKK